MPPFSAAMTRNTCAVSSGSASSARIARNAPGQSRLAFATGVAVVVAAMPSIAAPVSDNLDCQIVRCQGFVKREPMEKGTDREKRRYSGQSFEDRHAERRDRLVRAAAMVASRSGFDGTSVAALSAEAGPAAGYFF